MLKRGGRLPTEFGLGLGRIANEQVNLGWPVKLRIDGDDGLARGGIDAPLLLIFPLPFERDASAFGGHGHEVAHRLGTVGGKHEGVGLVGLQHAPHALHVVFGEAPVALGVEVAEFQHVQFAELDLGHAVGDFAGHELAATQRAFVVEQDAAAAEDAVALAVIHRHPMGIQLGHAIRAAGIEGRVFHLRNGLYLAEHLRGAGLVEADLRVDDADGLQQVQRPNTGDLRRGVRLVEADADEALSREVVDLRGTRALQQTNGRPQVRQVVFDQMQVRMLGNAQLFNAPEINGASTAVRAVDRIALRQEELRKISTILAGNSCNNAIFHIKLAKKIINRVCNIRDIVFTEKG